MVLAQPNIAIAHHCHGLTPLHLVLHSWQWSQIVLLHLLEQFLAGLLAVGHLFAIELLQRTLYGHAECPVGLQSSRGQSHFGSTSQLLLAHGSYVRWIFHVLIDVFLMILAKKETNYTLKPLINKYICVANIKMLFNRFKIN